MTTVVNGLVGGIFVGLLAAIPATIAGHDPDAESSPVETLVGRAGGDGSGPVFLTGGLYGGLAGGSLVALELLVLGLLSVPPTTAAAFGLALAWSALLFGAASLVRRVLADFAVGRTALRELLVFHLVYGLGLGIWIRVTWIT